MKDPWCWLCIFGLCSAIAIYGYALIGYGKRVYEPKVMIYGGQR